MSKLLEQAAKEFSDKYWSNLTDYEKISCFKAGAEFMQKEYEEKLRWIPVEEKHSPNWEHVLLKQSDGKITIGCYMSSQFNVEMCSDTIRVTHWRFIL